MQQCYVGDYSALEKQSYFDGSQLLNNTFILCWTRIESLQSSQLSLTEERMLRAAHMICSLRLRNCWIATSNLEFYHKTKCDPTYDVVMSIKSILVSLSFCGFVFSPLKSNMLGQAI